MPATHSIGDSDFQRLMGIPELRSDVLFGKAIASYGRYLSGKKTCCGPRPDALSYRNTAAAALSRYQANTGNLKPLIVREFGFPADSTILILLGGRRLEL